MASYTKIFLNEGHVIRIGGRSGKVCAQNIYDTLVFFSRDELCIYSGLVYIPSKNILDFESCLSFSDSGDAIRVYKRRQSEFEKLRY